MKKQNSQKQTAHLTASRHPILREYPILGAISAPKFHSNEMLAFNCSPFVFIRA
jgi:hypothetical protein